MSEQPAPKPWEVGPQRGQVTTVNGDPNLTGVQAGESVLVGPEGGRRIEVPAAAILTTNEQGQPVPIASPEVPDGGHVMLDGAQAVKLGSEVIGLSDRP